MTGKAYIVARGYGKMLRPLTCNLPKSLVPVGNRPLFGRLLDMVRSAGIAECAVLLDEECGAVAGAFPAGSVPGLDLRYLSRLHPFSLAQALRLHETPLDAEVCLLPGDLVATFALGPALAAHRATGADLTIVTARVDEPFGRGAVIADGEGRVQRILERPAWGEAFSDRVATGVVICRPAAFAALPDDETDPADRLPAALLARGADVRAHAAEGYFRPVESVEHYLRVHRDLAAGAAPFPVEGRLREKPGRFAVVGEGARIARGARLEGRVILGRGVTVASGASIVDAVVGDGCAIGEGADVRESVLHERVSIGPGASAVGCVIGAETRVMRRATVKPLACVADRCTIGEGAVILSRVKIWPHQEIAPGARVAQSVLWGDRFRHALFSRGVVTGVGNVDLTPETAARLGAAFGAALGEGATVSLSRDPHPASRLVGQALALGLNSVGRQVYHLKALPLPVAKYQARTFGDRLGLHVRMSPLDPNLVDVRPFTADGGDLPRARQKEIEALFFADDMRRAMPDAVGELVYPHRVFEHYAAGIGRAVDLKTLRGCRLKVVVDVAHGAAAPVLHAVFARTGVELVTLNANPDPARLLRNPEAYARALEALSRAVTGLSADLGILFDAGAEKIRLADSTGRLLTDDETMLAFLALARAAGMTGVAVVPPAAPNAAERLLAGSPLAARRGVVRSGARSALRDGDVTLACDGEGGFLLPAFQPAWDAILAATKFLELLARTGATLADIVAALPPHHLARVDLAVPRGDQAALFAALVSATRGESVDLAEGVRVVGEGGWELALPDPDRQRVVVTAEAPSAAEAAERAAAFARRVEAARGAAEVKG